MTGRNPPAHHPLRLRDRVERWVSRVLVHLPPRLLVRLSGEPPVVADGQALDPHVQLVRAMRRRRNPHGHGLTEPTVEVARRRFRREALLFRGPVTPVASVRGFEIAGDAGPLRVRHYAPESEAPLTVYLHGGGHVIGDLDTHDEACRILCRHAGMHLLSVEYRLSPENPFPAALDDTLAALRWARAHAAALGADPACVAIAGDSAGGNLAAVASQLAARAGTPPAAQLLIYPVTNSETDYPSKSLFSEGFFLSRGDREAFAGYYLEGTGVGGDDPHVSPLLAPDLSGLPPALVVTAGFDILRDEGEAYAAALQAAGTPARTMRIAAHGHGFVHMTGVSPGARRAMVQIAEGWRALLDGACANGGRSLAPRR